MNTDMHPTIESLAAFVERPDAAEFGATRKHIAVCAQCRKQVQGLSRMIDTLMREDLDVSLGDGASGAEDDMENFVETAKGGHDKAALKAALHYAAHSAAMRGHLQNEARTAPAGDARKWWWSLLTWRPHAWVMMPVTAAAAFALAVIVLPLLGIRATNDAVIAAYQDDAQVRLEQAAAPGLGFFHGAAETTAPFDGMRFDYDAHAGLEMRWAPVAGARDYMLTVSQVESAGVRELAKQEVLQPQVRFEHLNLEAGRRYQWLLSGTTADGARFYTGGGFVLANNE